LLAADYPFLDIVGTMLIFFLWIIWFWLLISVFADIFRRHDLSGLAKTGWLIFTILLPFLGVFIYLITQGDEMGKRNVEQSRARGLAALDDYSRGAADEIDKAKQLLDSGAITEAEFQAIKAKALA
jgi:Short C-terminal domain/Phospholipase_D-nuclease N-terminal